MSNTTALRVHARFRPAQTEWEDVACKFMLMAADEIDRLTRERDLWKLRAKQAQAILRAHTPEQSVSHDPACAHTMGGKCDCGADEKQFIGST